MSFAFTEAEHRTRIERARQTLAEKRLDGAICVAPEHAASAASQHGSLARQPSLFCLTGRSIEAAARRAIVGTVRLALRQHEEGFGS